MTENALTAAPVERLVMPLSFGSLFAGIGGFDLGFERAGMVCKWQVEIDPYANRVLAKHWPDVRRWPDVRTWPQPDTERVDVVCGGFPCQGISNLGPKTGPQDGRSGLWCEFARIVGDLRPTLVVVENVPAITKRGLRRVLGDLAACGYDAEWETIPASAVGAIHQRSRLFVVAYLEGEGRRKESESVGRGPATRVRSEAGEGDIFGRPGEREGKPRGVFAAEERSQWWYHQPGVCDLVHGVPGAMDRNERLGNAVVPQVAEWIGRRIIEAVESAA